MSGLLRRAALFLSAAAWPVAEDVPEGVYRAYPQNLPEGWEYGPEHLVDVIFLHGVGGHPRFTWQYDARDPDTFWPAWLGERIEGVRVLTVGYPSELSSWLKRGDMPIRERTTNILDKLSLYRVGSRPCVLVCHSMGGLIAKGMVRQLFATSEAGTTPVGLRDNLKGILFLGTPHRGAYLADILTAVSGRYASRSAEGLRQTDQYLLDLHAWFATVLDRLHLKICYETRAVPIFPGTRLVRIVPEYSSTIDGVTAVPMDRDHIELSRCRDRNDHLFLAASEFVRRCVAGAEADHG